MKLIRLYSRPACDLCENLEQALYDQFQGLFQLEWRDVDRDPQTREKFGARIPVLTSANDEVICETKLNIEAVSAYLTAL